MEVPPVDFSNLQTFHVSIPKRFAYVPDVVSKAVTARPYADLIREIVIANTKPGEDLLIVAHMKLFDHAYLTRAEDPKVPMDWEGRKVSTLSWGAGVGSNRFKSKVAVFMFGEFYIPRQAVITTVHGLSDEWPTDATLADANSQNLRGQYLTSLDGHLLRWTKQLASRGNVRNIDGMGKAGAMRLYSTMDLSRMLQSWPNLFPGAPRPVLLGSVRK